MPPLIDSLLNAFSEVEQASNGILYPIGTITDIRAETTWTSAANHDIAWAAAAAPSDLFAKYPQWVEEYIPDTPLTLLDAGCGYGRIAIPLLQKFPQLYVVGVDATEVMLNKFLELAKEAGVQDRVILYKGNLANLPIADHTFDFVLSSAVLLHLPRSEAPIVINELYRVLKPSGLALFNGSFMSPLNLEGIQNLLYERLRLHKNPLQNGPVRTYTRPQIRKLFQLHAWQLLAIRPTRLILLPRSVFVDRIQLPFGKQVRKLNELFSKMFLNVFAGSGLFVSYHDVAARKS